ncbi:MAG: hypothetical protein DMG92_16630 [Acidobacteria bacterium]|nr:MAG: hypothetical protein DMG92_16630 [Acidobacteriota bacterium]
MIIIKPPDMAAGKPTGVFYQPEQVIGVLSIENVWRIAPIRSHDTACCNFWMHHSIAVADFGKQITPIRSLEPRTCRDISGIACRRVSWRYDRSPFVVNPQLQRKNHLKIKSTQGHPVRKSETGNLAKCHDLTNMGCNPVLLFVKEGGRNKVGSVPSIAHAGESRNF